MGVDVLLLLSWDDDAVAVDELAFRADTSCLYQQESPLPQ